MSTIVSFRDHRKEYSASGRIISLMDWINCSRSGPSCARAYNLVSEHQVRKQPKRLLQYMISRQTFGRNISVWKFLWTLTDLVVHVGTAKGFEALSLSFQFDNLPVETLILAQNEVWVQGRTYKEQRRDYPTKSSTKQSREWVWIFFFEHQQDFLGISWKVRDVLSSLQNEMLLRLLISLLPEINWLSDLYASNEMKCDKQLWQFQEYILLFGKENFTFWVLLPFGQTKCVQRKSTSFQTSVWCIGQKFCSTQTLRVCCSKFVMHDYLGNADADYTV